MSRSSENDSAAASVTDLTASQEDGGAMQAFRPETRQWFAEAFHAPTPVQRLGWEAIQRGEHSLLIAPTGSGKTLAAFLWAIDRLARPAALGPDTLANGGGATSTSVPQSSGVRVLYVSPLKALAYDIERNLRAPRAGIARVASSRGEPLQLPGVDIRTGDTTQEERRRQKKRPEEILVTTPESLFLILTSQARETLRTVEWVIVDEVHAVAPSKRGAHLALSLERLAHLTQVDPQRIGLSATARPTSEVARFLGGDRPVAIVDTHRPPDLDMRIIVPVEDMTRPQEAVEAKDEKTKPEFGIWPVITPRLVALIKEHRSTIVFVNSRGLSERLAQRINEVAGEDLALAHHGSLAHGQRKQMEEALKAGDLPAIVATSSLELGIDMGAVDLVILVESPGSVARGLQRVGRAGHGVGEVSVARVFPKHRGDLLEATVLVQRMREGKIEALQIPAIPLDVLAQHIVAMTVVQPWEVAELGRVVRRAANFKDLPDSALTAVLDLLSGLYPSHDFADLRARINWDRERDILEARRGSRMVVVSNAGTIPDRGLYGVHLGPDGPRLGELDEEMVHESQAGQVITLGASTWRILEITRDRVVVEPAPGEPGRLPFWHGEGPGRPLELGRAIGQFVREISGHSEEKAQKILEDDYGLDSRAAVNLRRFLSEQKEATGTLPTDRAITIERFRDEIGDWRVCILSPFGARVHAPWALAIRAGVSASVGYDVQAVWSDDGIVVTVADGDEPPGVELLVPDPAEVEERVLAELARSPLFASSFRENAARALLLPRRRPGARVPLFAQRLRAQKLMTLAMEYPSFPMVLETYRSILKDVFDVPALLDVLGQIERREVQVHEAETPSASPFARGLVFAYVAAYLYQGDAPGSERRAQMLSLDMDLLREILGEAQLRELLDADAIAAAEDRLQRRSEARRVKTADGMHDVLRAVGDLSVDELAERCDGDTRQLLDELSERRSALAVRVAGRDVWVAVEDVALYRDALGAQPPVGLPEAFLALVDRPVQALLSRWSRTHGPFTSAEVGARFGWVPAQAEEFLRGLESEGRLRRGQFRPAGEGEEWCDPDVLREIKRRALAKLRGQVAPVPRETSASFLPDWHGVYRAGRATTRLEEAITRLQGLPLSVHDLETSILPARVGNFHTRQLDELGASGWLVWVGHSPIRSDDGRVRLFRRDAVGRLLEPPSNDEHSFEWTPLHELLIAHLESRGASFYFELATAMPAGTTEATTLEALADLVWGGLISNDTFGALRALLARSRVKRSKRPRSVVLGGRWSLVRDLIDPRVTSTEREHARATLLLDRHGIVARESMALE
ncbi:MAG: ATP-dependent Lhr-like helicase, partial [Myxococcota bacterium]